MMQDYRIAYKSQLIYLDNQLHTLGLGRGRMVYRDSQYPIQRQQRVYYHLLTIDKPLQCHRQKIVLRQCQSHPSWMIRQGFLVSF